MTIRLRSILHGTFSAILVFFIGMSVFFLFLAYHHNQVEGLDSASAKMAAASISLFFAAIFGIQNGLNHYRELSDRTLLANREAAQDIFRNLSGDAFAIYSAQRRQLLWWNKQAGEILGIGIFTSRMHVPGDIVLTTFIDEDTTETPKTLRDHLRQHDKTNMDIREGSVIRENDGKCFIFRIMRYELEGDCVALFLRDVSATVTRERELLEARKTAEDSTRMKNEFLANMSHEIRTPMNSILGFSQILKEEIHDPVQRQSLDSIHDSGMRLMEMLETILLLARIEAERVEVENCEFSPAVLSDEIRQFLQRKIDDSDIKLKVSLAENLPSMIIADREKIRIIIKTLSQNAVKFTNKGLISIRLERKDRENTLRIRISDTGIGMKPEDLQRLSNLFTQGDPGSERKFGGTGLGLTLVTRLVKMLEGSISIIPDTTPGTTFVVEIPVEIPQEPEMTTAKAPTLNRALCVDDAPSNLMLLHQMLSSLGIPADTEDSPHAAIDLFATGSYDLIFMDIHMPGMDGWDCLAAMMHAAPGHFSEASVVLLSGDIRQMESARERGLPIHGYLEKPFHLEQLSEIIGNLSQQRLSPRDDICDIHPVSNEERTLITALEKQFKDCIARMSIPQIVEFSGLLADASEAISSGRLQSIAQRLGDSADVFDIDGIRTALAEYQFLANTRETTDD